MEDGAWEMEKWRRDSAPSPTISITTTAFFAWKARVYFHRVEARPLQYHYCYCCYIITTYLPTLCHSVVMVLFLGFSVFFSFFFLFCILQRCVRGMGRRGWVSFLSFLFASFQQPPPPPYDTTTCRGRLLVFFFILPVSISTAHISFSRLNFQRWRNGAGWTRGPEAVEWNA
ncbi:hypothetical protein BZA05DRAFT_46276 [Tricharina praecox]|uniref:uncharacterized protein n=1 Tax=Tricharina praecox TaxID=43433 RepID=UPI002220D3D2|nr:uncharacterized protein BZA05DRAFT_46276 [Tricharina praecox]KAI5851881.1 hypothetical protein BZA05DRAFT_46276 [Tricharina praecox]